MITDGARPERLCPARLGKDADVGQPDDMENAAERTRSRQRHPPAEARPLQGPAERAASLREGSIRSRSGLTSCCVLMTPNTCELAGKRRGLSRLALSAACGYIVETHCATR